MSEPVDELDARMTRLLAELDELVVGIQNFVEAMEEAAAALRVDADLEAERVTHTGETHAELVRRLSKEARQR